MRAALGATGARLAREIMIESWYLPLPGPASGAAGDRGSAGARRSGACASAALARDTRRRGHARLRQRHHSDDQHPAVCFPRGTALERIWRKRCATGTDRSARRSESRLEPRVVIVFQLALCFVLLVCAGLLARTFHHLQRNAIGFQPQGVVTMIYDLPGAVTRHRRDVTERAGFHERLLTALRAQPEVISAGTSIRLPFPHNSTARTRKASSDSTSETGRFRPISGRLPE